MYAYQHASDTHTRTDSAAAPLPVLFSDNHSLFSELHVQHVVLFGFGVCTCGIHFLHLDMNSKALGTYLLSTVGLTARGLLPGLTKHTLCGRRLALFYVTFSTELKAFI